MKQQSKRHHLNEDQLPNMCLKKKKKSDNKSHWVSAIRFITKNVDYVEK